MSDDEKRGKPAIEVSRETECGVTHVGGVYGSITPFLGQVAF